MSFSSYRNSHQNLIQALTLTRCQRKKKAITHRLCQLFCVIVPLKPFRLSFCMNHQFLICFFHIHS